MDINIIISELQERKNKIKTIEEQLLSKMKETEEKVYRPSEIDELRKEIEDLKKSMSVEPVVVEPVKDEQPVPVYDNKSYVFFSPSDASDHVFRDKKWSKAVLEKKFDGLRLAVQKTGKEVKIITDHKEDVTFAFPLHTQHAHHLSDKDYIIDCEAVLYGTGNRPLDRNSVAKFISLTNSDKRLDDSSIIFHAFDIMYLSEDLRTKPWHERKTILNSLKFTNIIQEVSSVIVENEKKLESTVKMLGDLPGSEGAMIKNYDMPYELDGEPIRSIKYKTEQTIKARIIGVKKTNTESIYNYEIGVDVITSQTTLISKSHIHDDNGNTLLSLGTIENVESKASVGDIFELSVDEVWRHKTPKGIHYSVHKPHFKALQSFSHTTSLDELDSLVSSRGAEIIRQ